MARRGNVRNGLITRKVTRPAQGYYGQHRGKVFMQPKKTSIVRGFKPLRAARRG